MARTETLSVRLSVETRQILADSASTHDVAGASALARDILERWVADEAATRLQAGVARAVSFLRSHPDGWADDPADFFPALAE